MSVKSTTHTLLLGLLLGAAALGGCAETTPKELNDARAAYRGASEGPAAKYNPAQLHTAREALTLAERTFEEEGDNTRTRDRAYVAIRKAQLADTQARIDMHRTQLESMKVARKRAEAQELEQARTQLQTAEQSRKEAEARAARAAEELSKLASVKQEERGLVITLSGSVLFASNKAELLPAAQQRLSEVARALKEGSPEASIVVEGHTDAKGSENHNLELSARRAEAVRSYLVSQGVPEQRIQAQGLGFARPVANNKTAEGRANNRRVEIVVQPTQGRQQG